MNNYSQTGILEFEDALEALKFYRELLLQQDSIKSQNIKNQESYKKEILELHPILFKLKNPKKVIFDIKGYKTLPYWTILEILTELSGANPPLLNEYRSDLVSWSYDLLCSGRACYQYGTRWLNHNSLEKTYKRLKENPTSKRCYIPIFDQNDVGDSLDAPCNLGFSLLIRNNKLDLTLYTRSIDITKGFRYDLSLFSFLQQSIASWLSVEIGDFYYYCNSLHVYVSNLHELKNIEINSGRILEIEVDKNMEIGKYYEDIRKIIELESLTRNQIFNIEEKINKLNYKFSRDFIRVFLMKNNPKEKDKYLSQTETSIKTWYKNVTIQ